MYFGVKLQNTLPLELGVVTKITILTEVSTIAELQLYP